MSYRWPKFRRKYFAERNVRAVAMPEPLRQCLIVEGVAQDFCGVRADASLTEVNVDDRRLIRFATLSSSAICVDAFTGFVVDVFLPRRERPTGVSFINTSLPLFNRCVETLLVGFPRFLGAFDDDDDGSDNVDALFAADKLAARELEAELRQLDPSALTLGSWWLDVPIAALQMGDIRPPAVWRARDRRRAR